MSVMAFSTISWILMVINVANGLSDDFKDQTLRYIFSRRCNRGYNHFSPRALLVVDMLSGTPGVSGIGASLFKVGNALVRCGMPASSV